MSVTITGIFTWDGQERRSDRYGLVTLDKTSFDGSAHCAVYVSDPFGLAALVNERASIKAKVVVNRKSGHVGDLSRKIFPSMPDIGATFDLGVGTLRFADAAWSGLALAFGLEPDDGRQSDWFDPRILYQLHDQTVEITIEASDAPISPKAPEPEIYGGTFESIDAGDGWTQYKKRRLSDVLNDKDEPR